MIKRGVCPNGCLDPFSLEKNAEACPVCSSELEAVINKQGDAAE